MSRKGLYFLMGSAAVAGVLAVVGVMWWSKGKAEAYSGMAGRFPDSAAVFVEVRHLGQWMKLPEDVQVQPEPIKSQDPLLGVLGRVWAAERIRPEDLPVVLKDQPVAVGLWKVGDKWKGAGLLAVVPTVRQPLEEYLKGKLGQGQPAGEVAGIKLFTVEPPKPESGLDISSLEGASTLVWGVGESWAVVASGIDEARQVLTAPARPLDTDPDFLDAAARFPLEKGGWVFVRGAALQSMAETAGKHGGHDTEAKEDASKTGKVPPDQPCEGEALCCGGLGGMVASLFPSGSVPSMAMWSSPPQSTEGMWDVRAFVGRTKDGKGFFKLFTEGGSRRPDILGRVAKDGTAYAWVGGEDPAGFYKRFMDELARGASPEKVSSVRAAIGAFEGKLGVSLANDLLPTLGDEVCVVFKKLPGEEEGKEGEESVALYVSLRDSRRLQSLLREKVGPDIGLVEGSTQGVPSWSWKSKDQKPGEHALQLLVTGETLVVTESPGWALGSAPEGKAYKRMGSEEGKLSLLAVADGEGWNLAGKPPVVVSGTREEDGILVKASFSGERPKMPLLDHSEKEASGVKAPVVPAPKDKEKRAA
jgi:hypothetical protein